MFLASFLAKDDDAAITTLLSLSLLIRFLATARHKIAQMLELSAIITFLHG